jgi:hypothetical protein
MTDPVYSWRPLACSEFAVRAVTDEHENRRAAPLRDWAFGPIRDGLEGRSRALAGAGFFAGQGAQGTNVKICSDGGPSVVTHP